MSNLEFGINLNNREPLLAPEYGLSDLLRLADVVEDAGLDSVWVGDSLFSKPRYEALALLSAIAQRTSKVRLGTACLVSSTRNPLFLALEWATLDVLSNGRTIFGPCMGSPEEGVKREFKALGLDFNARHQIFEEGLAVVRELWTNGKINFQGKHFNYEDVSFYSGTEMAPLQPIQQPPPMWIVSNPRLIPKLSQKADKVVDRASRRIARYGDGWMTCCRARHVDEFSDQLDSLRKAVEEEGRDFSKFTMAYQVTMNIGETQEEANKDIGNYISTYYPELSQSVDLGEWGPAGTPDEVIAWLRKFADAGVNHFICRFGSMDQFSQVEKFTKYVLPAFESERRVA